LQCTAAGDIATATTSTTTTINNNNYNDDVGPQIFAVVKSALFCIKDLFPIDLFSSHYARPETMSEYFIPCICPHVCFTSIPTSRRSVIFAIDRTATLILV